VVPNKWITGFVCTRIKVFTRCRMARLFGRFRATVWFRCLCWNKGMILHKVKTQKDHFTVLLKRARIIFSLYKSTWHVSWTYSYQCCNVVFWRWWMTAGLTLWTSCIVCVKTEHAHTFLGPGLVPASRLASSKTTVTRCFGRRLKTGTNPVPET
jgi:hypothetical protein